MLICKLEDLKSGNRFRAEFIGKDKTGRKQYRGISFKKTLFGDIEDCNYYPLVKELIILVGKKRTLGSNQRSLQRKLRMAKNGE